MVFAVCLTWNIGLALKFQNDSVKVNKWAGPDKILTPLSIILGASRGSYHTWYSHIHVPQIAHSKGHILEGTHLLNMMPHSQQPGGTHKECLSEDGHRQHPPGILAILVEKGNSLQLCQSHPQPLPQRPKLLHCHQRRGVQVPASDVQNLDGFHGIYALYYFHETLKGLRGPWNIVDKSLVQEIDF